MTTSICLNANGNCYYKTECHTHSFSFKDAVNFTDPLLVNFQPSQLRYTETGDDEADGDSMQENFQRDTAYEESFSTPGFIW